MTDLRQAAQQALEALTLSIPKPRPADDDYAELGWKEHNAAITALRAALAEPEQDPVGWQWLNTCNYRKKLPANAIPEHWRPLYTAPTPRKPLTDEEILDANYPDGEEADPIIAAPDSELIAFSRAVMAVQRDKEGKPMAHWHGLIEPQKDAAAFAPRRPLTDYINAAGINGADSPHMVVEKLQSAIERAHGIGEQHE